GGWGSDWDGACGFENGCETFAAALAGLTQGRVYQKLFTGWRRKWRSSVHWSFGFWFALLFASGDQLFACAFRQDQRLAGAFGEFGVSKLMRVPEKFLKFCRWEYVIALDCDPEDSGHVRSGEDT